MTFFNQFPLQKALYQLLEGDAQLASLVSGVYDRALQGSVFPYITFGAWEGHDWSSMTGQGVVFLPVLQVWSREGGHKQVALIMGRLHVLLHDANPTLDSGTVISLRYTSSNIVLGDDGCTYCGTMRLRALVQA